MQRTRNKTRNERARGFTLVEALVIVGIVGILVAIGIPALQQLILRSKLEGLARETAAMMQGARFQAIKEANTTVLQVDTKSGELMSYVDVDADRTFTPLLGGAENDRMLKVTSLSSGLTFRSPEGATLDDIIVDFEKDSGLGLGFVVFNADGSAASAGAVRIADARDNFLEIRVEPRATARIEVQKWDENELEYLAQGENDVTWRWRSTPN